MPVRSINPFASNAPTPPLDPLNEKRESARRASFAKGGKFTALFGGSPKTRTEAAALREAFIAQQQALLNSPSPSQISLPTINLTTATGEKMPNEAKTLF